jgi:hypothetical protein
LLLLFVDNFTPKTVLKARKKPEDSGFGLEKNLLDKGGEIWSNIAIMRQINRKSTLNWWWPAEI